MKAVKQFETARETLDPAEVKEQVRRRAYELYEARGREDGRDLDDWLQAEAEIVGEQRKVVAA